MSYAKDMARLGKYIQMGYKKANEDTNSQFQGHKPRTKKKGSKKK